MSQLTRPRMLAAAVVALTLSISACGGSDEKTDSDSKAAGRTAAGTGYEITVPDGWRRDSATGGEELRLKTGDSRDGAAVTVSRVSDPPKDASLVEVAELVRQRLLATVPGLSPSELGESQPVSLGDVPARAYKAKASLEGHEADIRGLVTLHDDALYTIVFAAPAGGSGARAAAYESILESWQWKRVEPAAAADPPAGDGGQEVRPARGAPVVGSGYRFNLPRGWRQVNVQRPPPGLKVPDGYVPPDALVGGKVIEGDAVNASVVVEPTSSTSLDEFVDAEGARYFSSGSSPTDTSLGGIPAVAASRERPGIGDAPMRSETLVALKDGKAYVVEFSAPRDHYDKQVPAFRAAMASWGWQ